MEQRQSRLTGKRVGGLALMLLAAAMIGWGSHFLALNGNCSSTGYIASGPVPKCSGGEALFILSTFFVGPFVALIGWGLARMSGVMWPATCLGLGVGMITLYTTKDAPSGAHGFGLVVGVCFFALAALSPVMTVRHRRRKKAAAPSSAASASASEPLGAPSDPRTPGAAATESPATDPLDRIAKLAQLRDSGALTTAEFEHEKAKLLSQM